MSSVSRDPLIQLKNVDRTFKKDGQELRVLQDVSLDVYPNEILCVVGESGCGKTTTGKIVAGLLDHSGGEVLINGKSRESYSSRQEKAALRRALQIVHQDPFASLNPAHTIAKILSFPLLRHGMVANRTALQARLIELMNLVDLTPAQDILNKYPHQLSGGQRQRVSIARALTVQPKLIVADEAVSMVDVSIRIGLLKMLYQLKEDLNIAIVFITHDLALAKYFAWNGRIAVMYLGRIVEIGATQDVIANPAHPYTRALLAAVPEADPDVTRRKEEIPLRSEEIPGLLNIPSGCAFHPRCPFHEPGTCDTIVPHLTLPPGINQRVACTPLTRDGFVKPYAGG